MRLFKDVPPTSLTARNTHPPHSSEEVTENLNGHDPNHDIGHVNAVQEPSTSTAVLSVDEGTFGSNPIPSVRHEARAANRTVDMCESSLLLPR